MCEYFAYVYVSRGSQKRALNVLELVLQKVVSHCVGAQVS